MTQEPQPRFQIGDVVRIVDTPYAECPFTWVDEMTEFCGKEAVVIDVCWYDRYNAYGYCLDTEDCYCTWCENCFQIDAEIEESDIDLSILFQ